MSGYVIPLAPKRTLDFTALNNSTSETIVLADRVPLVHWREVTLLVDVHDLSLTNGSVTVSAYPQSWTPEDPAIPFIYAFAAASIAITSSTPNPAYLLATLPVMTDLGRIVVVGSRTAPGGVLTATISAKLSVKDA